MSAEQWFVLALYVVPVLIVFGFAAWLAERYERRHPPRNRRIR
jgi:cytochrome c oxidase assembly factor CtaG